MLRRFSTHLSVLSLVAASACTTPQRSAPSELTEARLTYGRVSSGEAAKLVPAQVYTAQRGLEAAEKSFTHDPGSQHTKDLAYIAQRQAMLAEINAQTEALRSRAQQAEQSLAEGEAKAGSLKQGELKVAKQKLAQVQLEGKSIQLALARASGDKNVKQRDGGLVITLSGNVLFDHGKAVILGSAQKQLNEIAQTLIDAQSASISIEGFTDSTGSKEVNEKLSQARADAVMKYFGGRGLPVVRMKSIGRGPSNPVASNDTAEGRATNRRVELVVQGSM